MAAVVSQASWNGAYCRRHRKLCIVRLWKVVIPPGTDIDTSSQSRRVGDVPINSSCRAHDAYIGNRAERKSVVKGKSVSVRVDLGGQRIIKKKKKTKAMKKE